MSLERPFSTSPQRTICSCFERTLHKVQKELATLTIARLMEPRRKLSTMPTDWIHADMPACTNICKHPTICVDTGDCQCVLSTCVPCERRLIFSSSDSFPSPPPESKGSSLYHSEASFGLRQRVLSMLTYPSPISMQ